MIGSHGDERVGQSDSPINIIEKVSDHAVESNVNVFDFLTIGSVRVAYKVGGRKTDRKQIRVLVCPERLAFKADSQVLVGLDRDENERRTYTLERIEKLKILSGGA